MRGGEPVAQCEAVDGFSSGLVVVKSADGDGAERGLTQPARREADGLRGVFVCCVVSRGAWFPTTLRKGLADRIRRPDLNPRDR